MVYDPAFADRVHRFLVALPGADIEGKRDVRDLALFG